MTREIQTVTGPISAVDLGTTLVHEHLLVDMYETTLNSAGVLLDERAAVEELRPFAAGGGRTIVDQTTIGLNPDWAGLRRISQASGVQVIAGTGVYWRRFRPAWIEAMSEADLTDRFVKDLTVGLNVDGGLPIRAGLIGEIATGHRGIDPFEASVFRAAAAAQRETGVPIATHALFNGIGVEQLDLLEAARADLTRVVVGHADTNPDPAYHRAILDRGAWLGFDTIGQLDKATDEWRADRIAEYVMDGYLGRILISSDVCKRPALVRNGGDGYAHVLTGFVPLLRERGLSVDEIDRLLRANPTALFA